MFGRRCSLCDGKLDGQMICTECGLNNSKSEKYYEVNKSSCDNQPLTHVHEERKGNGSPGRMSGRENQPQAFGYAEKSVKNEKSANHAKKANGTRNANDARSARSGSGVETRKPARKGKLVRWIIIITVIGMFMKNIGIVVSHIINDFRSESDGMFGNFFDSEENSGGGSEERDPYDTVTNDGYELPASGEAVELELASGKYIVGVHIPEGKYKADIQYDFDYIEVSDAAHSIYLYEYPAKEGGNRLDDLRLYEGAVVKISVRTGSARLTSENAGQVRGQDNPLGSESYQFRGSGELTAGKDFSAGVYDLSVLKGDATVQIA